MNQLLEIIRSALTDHNYLIRERTHNRGQYLITTERGNYIGDIKIDEDGISYSSYHVTFNWMSPIKPSDPELLTKLLTEIHKTTHKAPEEITDFKDWVTIITKR